MKKGSKDQPVNIVGAGLAGLTAAVILAKEGREVTVYEKGARIGGMPIYNPSPHGTPMDPGCMNRYLGFDVTPRLVPIESSIFSIWGKRYEHKFPANAASWMIERGPRSSSMDHYLADLAREHGASIEVGHPIRTEADLAELKKDNARVIMATGLHQDGFEASNMPFQKLYGIFAKCRVPWQEARVTVYFDEYSPDYAFTCSVNGIAFGLIFNRHRPVEKWEAEMFKRQAVEEDGYPFTKWLPLGLTEGEGSAAPTATFGNPRLFHDDLILAGTLSGMMDPILFFGMHGAFLTGRIAAMALDDPAAAEKEFKRLNATFRPVLAMKRITDVIPRDIFVKYPARLAMSMFPLYGSWAMRYGFMGNISGYGRY